MLVDEYQGSISPLRASLPRSLTVLSNDARYVVSVHPSCRGARLFTSRSVLRAANNEQWRRRGRLARSVLLALLGLPFHGVGGPIGLGGLAWLFLKPSCSACSR